MLPSAEKSFHLNKTYLYLDTYFVLAILVDMTDKDYIEQAIKLSKVSPEPIGCGVVIVGNNQILSTAFNSQRTDGIAINHAEIKAIVEANIKTGSRTLQNAVAYCSCEPCAMCLTALSLAKVERIVYWKKMADIFPDDPQSQLNSKEFVKGLNFVPKLEQLIF
jgi:tRNA(Arg) A34 adenosine deaminase TadA